MNHYVSIQIPGRGRVGEHVLVAEKALGRRLPIGAVVHHVDECRSNNSNDNLVICQDRAYHKFLHMRIDAFRTSGHADWRKCKFCKQYSSPSELRGCERPRTGAYHAACQATYSSAQRRKLGAVCMPQRNSLRWNR